MRADPHPTGELPRLTSIEGFLFVVFLSDEQPVLIRQPEGGPTLLPIFSTREKLQEAIDCWIKVAEPWKIQRVDDHDEFIGSCLEAGIEVAADPYLYQGNTRWTGFIPDPSPNN